MSAPERLHSVCVFCGSSDAADPAYLAAAADLGRALAAAKIRLVYGGGGVGLMGATARAAHDAGGAVLGVIPEFLVGAERALETVEHLVVRSMHERKSIMFEQSDGFVVLPGGIGTLEELVEQMTWSQLGQHTKPILMLSSKNFWKPLLTLLAHMREQGFIRPGLELNYLVAERVEDVIPMIEDAARRVGIVENTELIETKF